MFFLLHTLVTSDFLSERVVSAEIRNLSSGNIYFINSLLQKP